MNKKISQSLFIATIALGLPFVTGCEPNGSSQPSENGQSCASVVELDWEEKSPLGFSGKELATNGAFAEREEMFSASMKSALKNAEIVAQKSFDTNRPLTIALSLQEGKASYLSGPRCEAHLRIPGTLTLRSADGLLNEAFSVQLKSSDNEKLIAFSSDDGIGGLKGLLGQASSEPEGSSITQLDLSVEIAAKKGPVAGRLNAIIQTEDGSGPEAGLLFSPVTLVQFPPS